MFVNDLIQEGEPVPDAVPAVVLHAVHEHVGVRLVGKVPLYRFVGAVGVPDENLKPLLDHRVETAPDLGGQPRKLS